MCGINVVGGGGGLGKICAEFGAISDRVDVDRRALIFVHELAWKLFDVEVYDEFVFVSLFRVFLLSIAH